MYWLILLYLTGSFVICLKKYNGDTCEMLTFRAFAKTLKVGYYKPVLTKKFLLYPNGNISKTLQIVLGEPSSIRGLFWRKLDRDLKKIGDRDCKVLIMVIISLKKSFFAGGDRLQKLKHPWCDIDFINFNLNTRPE